MDDPSNQNKRCPKRQKMATSSSSSTNLRPLSLHLIPSNRQDLHSHLLKPNTPVYIRSKKSNKTPSGQYGVIVSCSADASDASSPKKQAVVRLVTTCSSFLEREQQASCRNEKQAGDTVVQTIPMGRLVPVFIQPPPPNLLLLVTDETPRFRQLVQAQLLTTTSDTTKQQQQQQQRVLEIGSSTGGTSNIVWHCSSVVQSWVGLDTSSVLVQQLQVRAQATNLSTKCVKVDALQHALAAADAAHTFGSPTMILVDIGGNRSLAPVLQMLQFVLCHVCTTDVPQQQQIIVKSRALYRRLLDCPVPPPQTTHNNNMKKLQQTTPTCISNPHQWLRDLGAGQLPQQQHQQQPPQLHPLQAPLRHCPHSKIPICRYHNYHAQGCAKGSDCPYDHDHCHYCLAVGHVAVVCPRVLWRS